MAEDRPVVVSLHTPGLTLGTPAYPSTAMRHFYPIALLAVTLTGCKPTAQPPASQVSPPPNTPPLSAQLVAEFSVRDLAASQAFYESLGFRTTLKEEKFVALEWTDGHKLFLSHQPESPKQPEKPTVNIRIGVAKVDEAWAKAQAVKARIITPIGDRFYGERDFLITDPDGFGLRFASLLPKGHW